MSTLDNLLDLQEQICYVKCGFCSTILLVSVPCSSLSMVVTVKCGHCTRILSVNMMTARLVPLHLFSSLSHQEQPVKSDYVQLKREVCSEEVLADKKAAITCFPPLSFSSDEEVDEDSSQVIHKPPEKKQRAPSAYNHFIKEEIKRLKIEYPNMTHKQAFSAAAKNWAHCPQSQYRGGEVHGYAGEADRNLPMVKQTEDVVVGNESRCIAMAMASMKQRH
ncbi:Axial regulator YABBY 4 [Sesamum alatum]|uniref:Axial regulator YABBY 4 n=1 Tax=Sesamum alatum TaxID=300844 RepID=A0AAE1YGI6_9LAMI|nr:Axial regulator YABBY 4 [Sesamum alatum]